MLSLVAKYRRNPGLYCTSCAPRRSSMVRPLRVIRRAMMGSREGSRASGRFSMSRDLPSSIQRTTWLCEWWVWRVDVWKWGGGGGGVWSGVEECLHIHFLVCMAPTSSTLYNTSYMHTLHILRMPTHTLSRTVSIHPASVVCTTTNPLAASRF